MDLMIDSKSKRRKFTRPGEPSSTPSAPFYYFIFLFYFIIPFYSFQPPPPYSWSSYSPTLRKIANDHDDVDPGRKRSSARMRK